MTEEFIEMGLSRKRHRGITGDVIESYNEEGFEREMGRVQQMHLKAYFTHSLDGSSKGIWKDKSNNLKYQLQTRCFNLQEMNLKQYIFIN